MKKIFLIILLLSPFVLKAQTAGLPAIFFSFGFLLFGGLILGLFEALIFRTLTKSLISVEKIILYNYLILVLSYLIFSFLTIINPEFFLPTIDSENSMKDWLVRERIATIKLLISIILYSGIVIGAKYLLYSKKRIVEIKRKNMLILLLIPNIILLGLYFYVAFRNLLWWFGG
jgi:hypothetical protein